MNSVPIYWHSSLDDVEDDLKRVKRGKVSTLLSSAGNRPIFLVEYGCSNLPKSQASLSSALGAGIYSCYADRSNDNYVPTVFLAGCIHGGEFEGTVAIMNLISLLETGKDLAGHKNDALLSVAEGLHLLLIPISNPDGRSHVPLDSFVGRTFYDLRYYNQGTWKNGELCGWPECKMKHPIKEHVDRLGGYFNDDGINMMHDDFFGDPCNEVKNILRICRDHAPDFSILLHGGDNTKNTFYPINYITGDARREIRHVGTLCKERFNQNGYEFVVNDGQTSLMKEDTEQPSFNLTSAMFHTCGAPCTTYESNQGLSDRGNYVLDHPSIYNCHMLLFEVVFNRVLVNQKTEKNSN